MAGTARARERPKNYPKLKDYKPTRFMLPESHYDAAKADRAVRFIRERLYSHVRAVSGEIPAHKTREALCRLI